MMGWASNIAHLVLGEFGLSPSTNDGKVVGLAQHFDYPNASVEVYTVSSCFFSGRKAVNNAPLDTLSSHGSVLKTMSIITDMVLSIHPVSIHDVGEAIPQNPVSKPTEKQVLSLLKAAESENGPTDSSITWRVFIIAMPPSST